MGTNADLLASLGAAGAEWKIDYFTRLEQEMVELESKMKEIRKDPGWTGESAEVARARVQEFEWRLAAVQEKLKTARTAINTANDLRAAAAAKHSSLPSGSVPWDVQLLIGAAAVGTMVTLPGIGVFGAAVASAMVADFYGSKREAAAKEELESLGLQLDAPAQQLRAARISTAEWPDAPVTPWQAPPVVYNGDSNGNGGWSTGGWTGGGGGGGVYVPPKNFPPRVIVDPPPPGDPDGPDGPDGPGGPDGPPTIAIDGNGGGVGGGSGSFMSGGGLGAGLMGGGAGAGALGAGAKLAAGGLGAGALLGGGGIGGGAGAGAAGAAGSKSSAMMGGAPGGGGGGGEKEKRSSLGLMAPKLEDDEETGPRSAAAGAGGRD